jgi:dipeptidyl aminopeptidase/acylaminoacyl peptidase
MGNGLKRLVIIQGTTVLRLLAGFALGLVGAWALVRFVPLPGSIAASQLKLQPAPGSQAAATSWIAVGFPEAMDRGSVQGRFSIDPPMEGRFHWVETELRFRPAQPLTAGSTYRARLEAGAISLEGRRVLTAVSWRFSIRPARVTFLRPAVGPADLYQLAPLPRAEGRAERLTNSQGVVDYAISPDGEHVALSISNPGGGADLWILGSDDPLPRVLVFCAPDFCEQPVWSPDGRGVIYLRRGEGDPGGVPWSADPTGGRVQRMLEKEMLAEGLKLSPDGTWLAFRDVRQGELRLLDLRSGDERSVGVAGAWGITWAPDGSGLAFVAPGGEGLRDVLYRLDLGSGRLVALLGPEPGLGEMGAPAWSPDGAWIALPLQRRGEGRQVWLIAPDGSRRREIIADLGYTYGGVHWDPWGLRLLAQRFPLGTPDATPQIVLWDWQGHALEVLAEDAWMARWRP